MIYHLPSNAWWRQTHLPRRVFLRSLIDKAGVYTVLHHPEQRARNNKIRQNIKHVAKAVHLSMNCNPPPPHSRKWRLNALERSNHHDWWETNKIWPQKTSRESAQKAASILHCAWRKEKKNHSSSTSQKTARQSFQKKMSPACFNVRTVRHPASQCKRKKSEDICSIWASR